MKKQPICDEEKASLRPHSTAFAAFHAEDMFCDGLPHHTHFFGAGDPIQGLMNDKAHTLPLTYTSNPKTAMF
jgi:hypothetical protein